MHDDGIDHYLLYDWRDPEVLARVNELLQSRGLGRLRDLGCFFADGICVEHHVKRGLLLTATRDIPAERMILVERNLLPFVPPFLYPQGQADVPYCHFGLPLLLVPNAVIFRFPALLNYLRMSSNSTNGGVFAVGSFIGHSCSANAERHTRKDGASAIVTTVPIAKGEEITVQYSNLAVVPFQPIRRLWLLWWRGFWCRCARCSGSDSQVLSKLRALARANADEAAIHQQISEKLFPHRGNLDLNTALLKEFMINSRTVRIHIIMSVFSFLAAVIQGVGVYLALPKAWQNTLPSPYLLAVGLVLWCIFSDLLFSILLHLGLAAYDR